MTDARGLARRVLKPVPPLYRIAANASNPASDGHRLRSVRKTIAFDVRTRLLRRPTVAPLGQRSKIIAYPGETNSPHAAYRNPPNAPEMFVWRDYLKPGDTIVDVGTNVGVYSIYAIDLGAEVIACEPDPRACARLREHLKLNGYDAEVHEVAVSNEPGVLRLTQGLDSHNHVVLDGAAGDVIEVKAIPLDDILGGRYAAGMKVDVEGAERLIVEGARLALSEHRIGLIQMEFTTDRSQNVLHEDRTSVADLLRDAGYSFFHPRRDGSLAPLAGTTPPGRDIFAASPAVAATL